MDSKLKELSAEELDLVTGGLEQPQYFDVDTTGKIIAPKILNPIDKSKDQNN